MISSLRKHVFLIGGTFLMLVLVLFAGFAHAPKANAALEGTLASQEIPSCAYAGTIVGVYGRGGISVTQGTLASQEIACFTSPYGVDTDASQYTVSIDWGDGTQTKGYIANVSPGKFSISGDTHAYPTAGTFAIITTVGNVYDAETWVGVTGITVTAPDGDLNLINTPASITTSATSSAGAIVTFLSPTVVDEDSPKPFVGCNPASGSMFAIGTTTVTCSTADSDDSNSPVSTTFTVTVTDSDLDLINMPTHITTNATSPQGTVVTYTPPTVVDEGSPLPAVSCNPASGSPFVIGTTTVTCTAIDSADTNSPVSKTFTVTVAGAADQISNLITQVNSFNLSPQGSQTSFDTQLQAVQVDLTANNTAQACSDLKSFINHVNAQSGKHLTTDQANQLLAAARQVQAVLAC